MSDRKVIVITGVTRGLGRAMVDEFITRGHIIAGCGRTRTGIEELNREFGNGHSFSAINVSMDAEVKSWSQKILEKHGPPDLLLNNAAIINRNAPLWQIDAEEFSQVIDVNIKGVANVIRHFVPPMIERRSGVIVNFSSGWGRCAASDVAPYCTTKWGIEGLTQSLAQELPSGMAAVPLNPGIINTEMLQSCFGDSAKGYPTAQQWAKSAVPFLMSLDARHNGQPLTVPGTRD